MKKNKLNLQIKALKLSILLLFLIALSLIVFATTKIWNTQSDFDAGTYIKFVNTTSDGNLTINFIEDYEAIFSLNFNDPDATNDTQFAGVYDEIGDVYCSQTVGTYQPKYRTDITMRNSKASMQQRNANYGRLTCGADLLDYNTTNGGYTYSVWFYLTEELNSSWDYGHVGVGYYKIGGSGRKEYFRINNNTGEIFVYRYTTASGGGVNGITTQSHIWTKGWHNIIFSVNITPTPDAFDIYVDGALFNSSTNWKKGEPDLLNGNFEIPHYGASSAINYVLHDEIMIFNRTLTSTEASNFYRASSLNYMINGSYESDIFDATSSATWNNLIFSNKINESRFRYDLKYRSCDDVNCLGESWNYTNNASSPISLNIGDNQYFQYGIDMLVNEPIEASGLKDMLNLPEIYNVTVNYTSSSSGDTIPPTITLNEPIDNYVNDTHQYVNLTLNYNVTDNIQIANCSLYHNISSSWSLNQTNTSISGISNSSSFALLDLTNTTFIWNVECCDNSSNCAFATANYTAILNWTTPPIATDSNITNISLVSDSCTINSAFTLNGSFDCIGNENCTGNYNFSADSASCSVFSGNENGNFNIQNGTSFSTIVQYSCSVATTYSFFFNATNTGDSTQTTQLNVTCNSGGGGLTAEESNCFLYGTFINGSKCAIGNAVQEEDIMNITIIFGLGIAAFILLYLAFQFDKNHYLLRLMMCFFAIILLFLIPSTLVNNETTVINSFLKIMMWVLRFFFIYIFLYFNYVFWIKAKLIDYKFIKKRK